MSVQVNFAEQTELEYVVSKEFTPSKKAKFQVISAEKAKELHFPDVEGKVNVYVINGGQKGDEGKGDGAKLAHKVDNRVAATSAGESTHNAGKGGEALDLEGKLQKFPLHLTPATLGDPRIKNYVGADTQVNPYILRDKEIGGMVKATGKDKLGVDYHLMVDFDANLVTPLNRADDVVNKKDTMGSTVQGATLSKGYAASKKAPLVKDVLWNKAQFVKQVDYQLREFNDRIKHDGELVMLGIHDARTLGNALQNEELCGKVPRLGALRDKLSDAEIGFFTAKNPAEYLHAQFLEIMNADLFYIGDTTEARNAHLERGEPITLEGVQSVPLSGPRKFGPNRTADGTHSAATIANANLDVKLANYHPILCFKFLNTSVGGHQKTMSGFIRQDALRYVKVGDVSLQKTSTLEQFLTPDQIEEAYQDVTDAFFKAFEGGYSLHHSKVKIDGLDVELSLVEAKALLTAYKEGETGVTSGRARITRFDDLVESGFVYKTERSSLQFRNAVDRGLNVPQVGIVTAYQVENDYGPYKKGDIVKPGMMLVDESLVNKNCVPIVDFLPAWGSVNANGTNELAVGDFLHEDLGNYLATVSGGNTVFAIGAGKSMDKKYFVKVVNNE